MNDETFEERFSFRQTPLGFLILLSLITIIMTTLVVSFVAFTPIREYIPGYADVSMRKELFDLSAKTDSLQRIADAREDYLRNLTMVLSGRDSAEHPANPTDTTKKYANLNFRPSREDSMLRKEIEGQDQYSLSIGGGKKAGISGFFFFSPVKGTVTSSFNAAEEHYGVDIAAPENEAVKATLDGTVVSSGWTTEDGYVIAIQHSNNITSIYKHNAVLLKKSGQFVKAGEPIAIIGNSGEQSTGPHLHFEIWYNGAAVDPQDYIAF